MVWTLGIATAPVPEERRLALTPELVAKYEQLGASIVLAKGAGLRAHWPDAAFEGVTWVDSPQAVFARADVVACVMPPTLDEIAAMRPGSVLVGALRPWASAQQIDALCAQRVTAFALELLPRITRAQPMDILSSQATVAGYEAALIAADHAPKFFPMLTYAAGTIRPAKVFVIGCGVAGLQAIATARRLGRWSKRTMSVPKRENRLRHSARNSSIPESSRWVQAVMRANSLKRSRRNRPRCSAKRLPLPTW